MRPLTMRLEQLPDAEPPPLLAEIEQLAVPPPASTLNVTVAVLNVAEEPVIVTVGLSTVLAVAVPGWLSPASLTARTSTATVSPVPKPVRVTSVTSVDRPPAATTYLVIGRPFSAGAAQVTRIAPAWSPTVDASTASGRSGFANGTTL